MAYPESRSCTQDLHAGMTDGSWKKAAPDRGGVVEETYCSVRRLMSGAWHGFSDSGTKVLPDGRIDHPPYHAEISPEDNENI